MTDRAHEFRDNIVESIASQQRAIQKLETATGWHPAKHPTTGNTYRGRTPEEQATIAKFVRLKAKMTENLQELGAILAEPVPT